MGQVYVHIMTVMTEQNSVSVEVLYDTREFCFYNELTNSIILYYVILYFIIFYIL